MKFTTNLISMDFEADTATFHLPPGTRMGAGTYRIEWLAAGQPPTGRPTEKAQEQREAAGAAGAAGAEHARMAERARCWAVVDDIVQAYTRLRDERALTVSLRCRDAIHPAPPVDQTGQTTDDSVELRDYAAWASIWVNEHGYLPTAKQVWAHFTGRELAAQGRQEPEAAGAGRQEHGETAGAAGAAGAGPWKVGREFLPYHPSASHVLPDYRDGWNRCYAAARSCGAWQPQFDAISHKQETLVLEFCAEIAGPKGKPGRPPDPVRLLEMAEALYDAEREDLAP